MLARSARGVRRGGLPTMSVRYASTQPPAPAPGAAWKAAGKPLPQAGSPPPRGNALRLLWRAQYVFGGIALFAGGFWLASSLNAQDPNNRPNDRTLLPSKFAIEQQERFQPVYGSKEDYLNCIKELKAVFKAKDKDEGGGERVSVDEEDLTSHGISDWSYHDEKRPNVVVWVKSTEEVQEVVLLARRHKVPITPFSGGTSLEGHFSSPYGGISLDMSQMDQILRVSEADADVTVQPGVKWEDLNAHLKAQDIPLFFPLDPGPGATIGGMAATGCSGTNAVRYGTAKAEWFLNLTVVLPSGEVIKTRRRARKSAAGWDSTKLFIGAEGTLGIITEATLRLAPRLPTKCAVVSFADVKDAVSAATEVVNAGYPVQCVEFLDARTMEAINKSGLAGRQYTAVDSLFFKFQGADSAMAEVSKGVQQVVGKHGGRNFEFSKSDKEADALWQGRKAALWAVMGLKEDARVWTTDICVPISQLPAFIKETKADFEERGILACHLGHVGDGNVHSLALFNTDEELERIRVAVHEMVERAIKLDGTCSGEHGVGVGKVEYLDTELGRGTVNLMETVKRSLDPDNLFNPGKLYPHIKPHLQK